MTPIRLAIIGVGLIGGSLGLALKDKLKEDIVITGLFRSRESMEKAIRLGVVDKGTLSHQEAVSDAQVVYLSTPVLSIVPEVKKILPFLKPGTILTDAGSTKKFVTEEIKKILPTGIYFIPGHPMTGREKSGASAAQKDLFRGKAYCLIDDAGAPKEVMGRLMELLLCTEARFLFLHLDDHDRAASRISHIPHIAAAALVHLLGSNKENLAADSKLIGGGFKDTTRIASSNADMWTDICLTNREALLTQIEEVKSILNGIKSAIEQGDREKIHDYFRISKEIRDNLLLETSARFDPN